MVLKKQMVLIAVLISICYINSFGASFFTDRGSLQIGGGMVFESGKSETASVRTNTFIFGPLINFFPAPFFLLGPAIDFEVRKSGSYTSTNLNLGGRAGFAYGRNIPVVPFVWASPQFLLFRSANNNYDNTNLGFGLEIQGGVMVPIKKHFSINVGPGLWFQIVEGFGYTNFHFEVSVTGLIF